jgi:sec-independent protein translocase protein TatC
MIPAGNSKEEKLEQKPFLEHLEDLRVLIIQFIVSWGFFSLIAFFQAPRIFRLIEWPLVRGLERWGGIRTSFALRSLSPSEVFLMSLKLSLLAGFIVALPLMLYFAARFLLPALTPKEKRYLLPSFSLGGGLFFGGVLFAYGVVLPLSLRFFWRYTVRLGVRPEWTVQNYFLMAGRLFLGFGLVFEFPVVIILLALLGVVDYEMLRRKRPYAVVVIFITAALLTPPDVITQVLMALPLLVLFELCLLATRFVGRSA